MLAILRDDARPIPGWLANASAGDDLPLRELLRDSMFYPACGLDGRPVQYFGGAVHSFVYVDEARSKEDVTNNLNTFKGYRLLFAKPVEKEALDIESFEQYSARQNGHNDSSRRSRPIFSYALWAAFERAVGFDADHGPVRFSLLYIGGEAVSAYWSLYERYGIAPFAITLIKCDGFTGNWTSFRDDRAELARLVIRTNWIVPPRYLFCESAGRESDSPWRWFSDKVTTILGEPNWGGAHHQYLTVWRLDRPPRSTRPRELSRRSNRRDTGPDCYPRPLILGLGDAGEAFAMKLSQNTSLLGQSAAVDVFGFSWHSRGLDCSDFDRESIEGRINRAAKMLLVVCGGGTQSGEMARFAATWAKFKNVQLDVILSTPMSWEGKRRTARATSLIEFLRENGATVTVVVGDHYDDGEEDDFRALFSRVDDALLKEVRIWVANVSQSR